MFAANTRECPRTLLYLIPGHVNLLTSWCAPADNYAKKKGKNRIAPFDERIGTWPNSSIANRMVVCKTAYANALSRKSHHHRLRLNHFPKNLSYGFRPRHHLWQQFFEKRSKSLFRGHYNPFWQSSMHVCDKRPRVRLDIASRSLIFTIKSFLFFARMSADTWFLHIGSWGGSTTHR